MPQYEQSGVFWVIKPSKKEQTVVGLGLTAASRGERGLAVSSACLCLVVGLTICLAPRGQAVLTIPLSVSNPESVQRLARHFRLPLQLLPIRVP